MLINYLKLKNNRYYYNYLHYVSLSLWIGLGHVSLSLWVLLQNLPFVRRYWGKQDFLDKFYNEKHVLRWSILS